MKKVATIGAVIAVAMVLVFSKAYSQEQCECWMLNKKIFQIFEKYPARFADDPAEDIDEEDGGNKSEIYFLIEDGVLLPGTYIELVDGSVVYWTTPGDTFSGIFHDVRKIRDQNGRVSRAEIEAEARKQGLKSPDKLAVNDILVFKKGDGR